MDDQLNIMFPDRDIQLSGEPFTVREFSYIESIKLASKSVGLINSLAGILSDQSTVKLSDVETAIADNIEDWIFLLAASIGEEPDFVAQLDDKAGTVLSMAFWEVNGPFLLRRVMASKIWANKSPAKI
jgi:Family of unknown function (DUF6631)